LAFALGVIGFVLVAALAAISTITARRDAAVDELRRGQATAIEAALHPPCWPGCR
jgi:hypothetical protein